VVVAAKERLNRDQMAALVAEHLQPGWFVNLGIGIPTLASNFIYPEQDIILHSEHGLVGFGPMAPEDDEDLDVANASGEYVTLNPGAVVVHHADSFAMVRKGLLDVVVLGAYQVDQEGSFANWKISTDLPRGVGNSIGGAMDLAQNSKQVFLVMEHTTRDGKPRLMEKCDLPLTAVRKVTLVVTDIAVVAITPQGFELQRYAPGYSVEEIQSMTGAPLAVSPNLRPAL